MLMLLVLFAVFVKSLCKARLTNVKTAASKTNKQQKFYLLAAIVTSQIELTRN